MPEIKLQSSPEIRILADREQLNQVAAENSLACQYNGRQRGNLFRGHSRDVLHLRVSVHSDSAWWLLSE